LNFRLSHKKASTETGDCKKIIFHKNYMMQKRCSVKNRFVDSAKPVKIRILFTVKILLNHETHEIHETSKGDQPVAPTAFA